MVNSKLNSVISILRQVQLFEEMDDSTLQDVASKLKEVTLQEGEPVIYKGEKGHSMYIIVDGEVKVHDGDHVFAHLDNGQFFGEYALIDTEVRSASVTGIKKTTLYRLEQKDFYQLASSHIGFIKGILTTLIARLRNHDIIQEQLAQSNKRIKKQKTEIEKINEELRSLHDEKNQLIGIIAHDLRNPLTSSISISTEIRKELERYSPDQVEYLDAMIKSLWRMNEMISRILDVRSIDTKKMAYQFERTNLGQVLQEVHKQFQLEASKKDISIILDTVDAYADLDPNYSKQVFENLISNAVKFSPRSKQIHISQKVDQDDLITEIKDQGPGLSTRDKGRIFNKFQKLSASPTGGETSVGLGLSIVKKYVDEMNGKVWVDSEEGSGATFAVSFKKHD